MHKNILKILFLTGLFLFASFQLLPLIEAISIGFKFFPQAPFPAIAVGLLLYSCCFAGLLRLEWKELFGSRQGRKVELSGWLIALGINALIESVFLFLFLMIIGQPLADWLNGRFYVDELGISFLFLVVVIVLGMVGIMLFWLLSHSKKPRERS
ncbi:MAG TPA: hypothetical protein VFN35_24290 [Ktedonobacteraceae bacterium]|nr:hypothetical protein [Ktedonobacteraceae bacterium]